MPFIRKPKIKFDRWIEYSMSILGVHWSLTKMKILILLHMHGAMTTTELMKILGKPRSYIITYLKRLERQGKTIMRHQEFTHTNLHSVNQENKAVVDALNIVMARYGNRLRRKEPFARPKSKEKHPRIRTYNPTKTYRPRRKKS